MVVEKTSQLCPVGRHFRTLLTFQEQRTSPSFVAFDDWGDDGEFLDDDLDWSPARNTPPPPPYTEGPKDDSGQLPTL